MDLEAGFNENVRNQWPDEILALNHSEDIHNNKTYIYCAAVRKVNLCLSPTLPHMLAHECNTI